MEGDAAVVSDMEVDHVEHESGAFTVVNDEEEKTNGEEQPAPPPPLKPLQRTKILPPRQKQGAELELEPGQGVLALPPLQLEEPVQSLRLALSEVIGYAQMTNYRLEIEDDEGAITSTETAATPKDSTSTAASSSKKKSKNDVPGAGIRLHSPFTGPNAVVCTSHHHKSLDQLPSVNDDDKIRALDIYGDLQSAPGGLEDGAAFRIVLEQYDAASIKEQVLRTRHLLTDGNAPHVASLVDEETEEAVAGEVRADESQEMEDTAEKKEPEPSAAAPAAQPNDKPKDTEEKETPPPPPLPKLPTMPLSEAKVDSKNLADFFYLACGEDPKDYQPDSLASPRNGSNGGTNSSPSRRAKKKKGGGGGGTAKSTNGVNGIGVHHEHQSTAAWIKDNVPRLNALEEDIHVNCQIRYSGFHPPPSTRRLLGDLAYLEFVPPPPPLAGNGGKTNGAKSHGGAEREAPIHITATTTGFYVSKSRITKSGKAHFDPAPKIKSELEAEEDKGINKACFSHSLLDCLLQASPALRGAWQKALSASKERAAIMASGSEPAGGGTLSSLFRVAIRGDLPGFATPSRAAEVAQHLDASIHTPTWLVPLPRCKQFTQPIDEDDDDENVRSRWNGNLYHDYNPVHAENELTESFGVDIRNGGQRDWNEELQLAREMPTTTILERIDRARAIHKAMTEFGEASLMAIQAIFCDQNQIVPMNPNEGTRTQVYLHNNIFISRAIDCGPETFRMVKGDGSARKAASREIQCIKTFSRMEHAEFFTLATVLVDYLGARFVCQSILPGILSGEKSHTVLLGSVDTDVALKQEKEFKELIEEKIGVPLNLLSRRIYASPLTPERREECHKMKKAPPLPAGMSLASVTAMERKEKAEKEAKKEEEDPDATISTCAPLEAKGIKGSDQRRYLLDFGRMTPRDANWVPKANGGTGKFDGQHGDNGNMDIDSNIPKSLEDDEWTMNVLRPELINRWIRNAVSKAIQKKTEEKVADEKVKKDGGTEDEPAKKDKERPPLVRLSEEEQRSITSDMKLNVNVFIPDVRVVDKEETAKDESTARDAAAFLWDDVLPMVTRAIKEGKVSQVPLDGRALTEFLHRHGINCRYMGRLAELAKAEEETDAKITAALNTKTVVEFQQKTMTLCWLDLLECEMVARAAKHVLDRYLTENGGVAASRPLQTIATFLSALVSEREETAAQTETRLSQRSSNEPDEEEFQELSLYGVGGDGDAVPPATRSRTEIWQDIEAEVGRRFRYKLTLYNTGSNKSGRAMHIPLLRRVCIRTGVRLAAKNYEVGGRGYTGGSTAGGQLSESYPISPLDIVDVVPLMKHSAAYHEGFMPCAFRPALMTPPLQVSLVDAKTALERAHIQMNARALQMALELAQEAASLYQRVTENGAHPGVVDCMELMATIFLEAGDAPLAVINGAKTLGIAVQGGGFDGQNAFNLHMTLFQMCLIAREMDSCVRHLRAAIYILELMGGPRHFELAGAYQKLATVYANPEYKNCYSDLALQFARIIQEHSSCDRIMEGFIIKSFAKSLADAGEYKEAVEVEKRANRTLAMFLGKNSEWLKESDQKLYEYTKLATQKGSRIVESQKMQEEAIKAEAVAADLIAAEKDDDRKKKKKKKGKGKK